MRHESDRPLDVPEALDPRAWSRALGVLAMAGALLVACSGAAPPRASAPAALPRRPFVPRLDGAPILAGVAYGPYRQGQSPDGAQPSDAQILEDLELMSARWSMIRVYGAQGATATVLRLVRERRLPLQVMLGAWIGREQSAPDAGSAPDPARVLANDRELDAAIRLANAYPDVVFAVCVGNETQVSWSSHRTPVARLVELLRRARGAVRQPVSTADDYAFWTQPESAVVGREIDFLVLHAYAMWNRQTLDDAVPWTARQVEAVRAAHPAVPVLLGETGWATRMHPSGDAARQIIGAAGEAEQARFYREFTSWARRESQPFMLFEAFDEPWKGGPHPDEVEKHWGLFRVDRTPKPALLGD